ncbi:hypothetical protein DACRYDRAFT_110003 [Dacryopinax primogenitus]|uniref:Uncharacterized protein n=1 Tax=Dacryopinax primogenitus (strain DJM 731) TaxID=1858805 RepID=M5G694_DACPD|nr:uncharacterized protein DACRYDRAFT_110003 [Dacryopinax primogenitus]EJT99287.1 hypothetical protein DACRYDRAFT_110003 [Dacryopinax primogenitus]
MATAIVLRQLPAQEVPGACCFIAPRAKWVARGGNRQCPDTQERLGIVYKQICEKCPYLERYTDGWATKELIKQTLRNHQSKAQDDAKGKKRKPKAKAKEVEQEQVELGLELEVKEEQ